MNFNSPEAHESNEAVSQDVEGIREICENEFDNLMVAELNDEYWLSDDQMVDIDNQIQDDPVKARSTLNMSERLLKEASALPLTPEQTSDLVGLRSNYERRSYLNEVKNGEENERQRQEEMEERVVNESALLAALNELPDDHVLFGEEDAFADGEFESDGADEDGVADLDEDGMVIEGTPLTDEQEREQEEKLNKVVSESALLQGLFAQKEAGSELFQDEDDFDLDDL